MKEEVDAALPDAAADGTENTPVRKRKRTSDKGTVSKKSLTPRKRIKNELTDDITTTQNSGVLEGGDTESSQNVKKPKNGSAKKEAPNKPAENKPEPKKKSKKQKKEEPERWKWWEQDEALEKGHNWKFMEHKGPIFPPLYERLPAGILMQYDGEDITLSEETEEVMTFYAKMLDHDYTSKDMFNKNFFEDWRSVMTHEEKLKIEKLSKCKFDKVCEYFKGETEKRKSRSKEEKKSEKDAKDKLVEEKGYCNWDGHMEKIGNLFIEPPGLFRGRGEHPKMGKLKKRVTAEQVTINCSEDAKFPPPPEGHLWKTVQHDPTVTWLATWTENVQGQNKYVMLNANSKIKGSKDHQKYEKARQLHKIIDRIREDYRADFKSREMMKRQRAIATYFIDTLALRAGNEKDADEVSDTVGCCSIRVEHIILQRDFPIEEDGKRVEHDFVIVFDFLGKDSMRYYKEFACEKRIWKNVKIFMEGKQPEDDLFDRIDTSSLNKHLTSIMPGLTAKVFRTYNASYTLQNQLRLMAKEGRTNSTIPERVLQYNRANRDVAVLCNHQRAEPKGFGTQMEKMDEKITAKRDLIAEKKKEVEETKTTMHDIQKEKDRLLTPVKKKSKKKKKKKDGEESDDEGGIEKCDKTLEKATKLYEQRKKQLNRLNDQLDKLKIAKIDKDENKTISLGTSKLNYLDPRISVAWCKQYEVPLEKVYSKTHRDKFQWAIDMVMLTEEEFVF